MNFLKTKIYFIMGTTSCSAGKGPTAITLKELQNIPLNGSYIAPGCTAAIAGTGPGSGLSYSQALGLSWPQNGEFAWGEANGTGQPCVFCSGLPGCDSCVNSQSGPYPPTIAGVKPTVVRVAYNADPTTCCMGNTQLAGNYTCDPKYLGGFANTQPVCQTAFSNYCSQGNNSLTDSRCATWGKTSPSQGQILYNYQKAACVSNPNAQCQQLLTTSDYSELLTNYLNANPSALNTKSWRDLALSIPGKINTIATDYCNTATNMDTDFCSCIETQDKVAAYSPECINAVCSESGYKLGAPATCIGPYTTCVTQINAIGGNAVIMSDVVINQNCGNSTAASTSPSYTNTTASVNAATTNSTITPLYTNTNNAPINAATKSAPTSSNTFLIILILIIVILIGGATYIFLDDGDIDFSF